MAAIGNKYALGNNGGRPAFYNSPEELSAAVEAYFVHCEGESVQVTKTRKSRETGEAEEYEAIKWIRQPEHPTVTGLTLWLGFAHRQSLDDYEEKAEYSDIIKRARTWVEHGYEKRLFHDRPAGAIFALTNMGWKNQAQFDHTSKGERLGTPDVSKLSSEDLAEVARIQQKMSGE